MCPDFTKKHTMGLKGEFDNKHLKAISLVMDKLCATK